MHPFVANDLARMKMADLLAEASPSGSDFWRAATCERHVFSRS